MLKKTMGLDEKLYKYFLSVSLREADILRQLREETAHLPNAIMQIAPEQGQFMALLIKLLGAKKTLEVGVFTGYSSLCVALELPMDGNIVACDVSDEYTTMARRYWLAAGVAVTNHLHLDQALATLHQYLADRKPVTFALNLFGASKRDNVGIL